MKSSLPRLYNLRTGKSLPIQDDPELIDELLLPDEPLSYRPLLNHTLELYLDLTQIRHGYAYFRLEVGVALAAEGMVPKVPLLSFAVAAQRATAPVCWRYILNDYLAVCATARPGETYQSVPAMPRPRWAIACPYPAVDQASEGIRLLVWSVGTVIAAELCKRTAEATEKRGNQDHEATIDPGELPEFEDLADDE